MTMLNGESRFSAAADSWLEYKSLPGAGRARFVSPRSLDDLRQYVKSLKLFFGAKRLRTIGLLEIRQYQSDRASGKVTERHVSPNKINQEIGTLIRIMKYAHCWTPALDELYMPLQREESDIPQALTPSEQQRWLQVAACQPSTQFIYWYSLLCFDCPLSTNEARGLRIGDVDLSNNVLMIRVRSSKNRYRTRTIPLSEQARWAIDRLIERAATARATQPNHYLMPFRKGHAWNPEKPMTVSGIKRTWGKVRKASGLDWFTPYDTRHTSITRYAEAGTPIPVILSLAGHVSQKMQEHYTHISEQAKRKAVSSVSRPAAKDNHAEPDIFSRAARLVKETGISVDAAVEIVTKLSARGAA